MQQFTEVNRIHAILGGLAGKECETRIASTVAELKTKPEINCSFALYELERNLCYRGIPSSLCVKHRWKSISA
ncbi:MAG: hypothetical protein ACQXXH_06640 [Candidatus Bathyarchaeia archaeon]|nr:hypothetical protein [Candidatus Bathyarchaeota archaeon A05DMB-4]MDH7595227.1 hypothetical protein [Candidatus Bathyarchaeota archaeon]